MRLRLPLNKTFFIAARRKKSGSPTFLNIPGANTTANRRLLLPSTDSRVVHVNEQTGDDTTGDGSQGNPFKTYAKARTEIDGSGGSLTTVEWQTDDGLHDDLNRPTQASIGKTPQLLSLATTFVAGGITGSNTDFEDISNDNRGRWIGVGSKSPVIPNMFITDDNGISWSSVDVSSVFGFAVAQGITTNGNDNWVAVAGGGTIGFSSDNGDSWTVATTPSFGTTNIAEVTTDRKGTWVAVGLLGKIAFSTDNGDNWTQAATPSFGTSAVLAVATDRNGNWVAGGASGKIAFSTDNGDNWTQATTPSFGTDTIGGVTTDRVGRWVAVASGGKAAFSTDNGDNWTQASVTNFTGVITRVTTDTKGQYVAAGVNGQIIVSVDGGDNWVLATGITAVNIEAIEGDEEGNYIAGAVNDSQISGVNLTADLAGFIVKQTEVVMLGTFKSLLNCTIDYNVTGITLSLQIDDIQVLGCRVENDIDIAIEAQDRTGIDILDTLAVGNVSLDASAVGVADDWLFNNNTIIGNISLDNSAVAEAVQVRDNIIEGNFTATAVFVIESGNIRGVLTIATVSNRVSSQDPLFADLIDFKLQRESEGFPFDSNLVHASIFSTLPDGTARDMGAYNADDSTTGFAFREAEFFPKPESENSIEFAKLTRANLQIGSTAEPSVYNDPDRQTDVINLRWQSLFKRFTDFIDRLEDERDLTVQIAIDPQITQTLPSITVNGAHTTGDTTLNIQQLTVLAGTILTIVDKTYFVIYADPGFSDATRLILDRPLEDDVADLTVLVSKFPITLGEFLYVPPREKRISRPAQNTDDLLTGLTMQLVRKRER